MDQISNNPTHDDEEKPRDAHPPVAAELSMLAASFDIGDFATGVAAIVLIGSIAYAFLRMIWPLGFFLAKWLDYRRYLNGGVW